MVKREFSCLSCLLIRGLLLFIGLGLVAPVFSQQTKTWVSDGTTFSWNTPENWDPNGVPAVADDAVFDGLQSTINCNIDIPVEVNSIFVNSDYSGTITQTAGNPISIASPSVGFTMQGGTFTGSALNTSNDIITIDGDIVLDATNANVIFTSTAAILGVKNLFSITNAASFIHNNGTVIFNGSANQTVTTGGGVVFYDLTLNKTGGNLILNAAVAIANTLLLTNGIITTSNTNLLTINDGAIATGASDLSFIEGPMVKKGTQPFVFPVGKNNLYNPIEISAPSDVADAFLVEYFDAGHPQFADSKDAALRNICDKAYWTLDRISGSSDVKVTLHWNGNTCFSANPDLYKTTRYDGTLWIDEGGTPDLTGQKIETLNLQSDFPTAYSFAQKLFILINTENVNENSFTVTSVGMSDVMGTSGTSASEVTITPVLPTAGNENTLFIKIDPNLSNTGTLLNLQISYDELMEISDVSALFGTELLPLNEDYFEIADGYKLYFYTQKPTVEPLYIQTNLLNGTEYDKSGDFVVNIPQLVNMNSNGNASLSIFKDGVSVANIVIPTTATTFEWKGTSAIAGSYKFEVQLDIPGGSTRTYKGQFIIN